MIRTLQLLIVLTAATVCAMFASSCNLMEGINQTSPNYRRPVPFSEPWWDAMKIRQKQHEIRRIEEDWGVHNPILLTPHSNHDTPASDSKLRPSPI